MLARNGFNHLHLCEIAWIEVNETYFQLLKSYLFIYLYTKSDTPHSTKLTTVWLDCICHRFGCKIHILRQKAKQLNNNWKRSSLKVVIQA